MNRIQSLWSARARSFLLAVTVCAPGTLAGCTTPGPQVQKNLELGRFEGRWYEIARVPRDYDAHCHDTVADYRRTTPGQMDVRHTCFMRSPTGPVHEFRAVATADDPSEPAKMSLQIGSYTGAYWVLDVGDRYEYALVGHPSRTALWVLSRTPSLGEAEWNHALSFSKSQGFDIEALRRTPQSGSR
ncbi:MAG TPA: lipocalin family protein [Polyangiaceae bacterium]|nr:lipocalin family protein [Polyangiaceae bacterium]